MSDNARSSDERLSVDASGAGLLAHLEGRTPEAPAWFLAALAHEPERSAITVEGANIELLTWGERGRPGLLFLHGNGAHADWWRFIAPFFAQEFRVAALTWSGMGGSDWRERYGAEIFAAEVLAAIDAAGLDEGPVKPLIVAHSFGGFIGMACAADHGDRLRGVVLVDAAIEPPQARTEGPPRRRGPNRIYPTFEAALARFRLAPPQPCENLFAVDFIARRSIKTVADGFTWKFDPFVFRDFDMGDLPDLLAAASCPIALVWGANSNLVTPEVAAFMTRLAPAGSPLVAIPEADHHVMLDQPLPFTAAIRGLFSSWPR